MIKKLSVILLCLVIIFSFAACNTGDLKDRLSALENENKELKDLIKDLEDALEDMINEYESVFQADVFMYDYADRFYENFKTKLEEVFPKDAVLNFYANNVATRINQIETAIADGSDVLIVIAENYDNDANIAQIINKAKDADIPVIFYSREVSDSLFNSYQDEAAFVGVNIADSGRAQGKMIAEYLLSVANTTDEGEKSKFADLDGNINYVMLRGSIGNIYAQYRTMYSVTEAQRLIAEAGKNWKLVASPFNNDFNLTGKTNELGEPLTDKEAEALKKFIACDSWSFDEAMIKCENIFESADLTDKAKLGIIIANNDGMALGAIAALNEKGYNTGTGAFIPVFGIDADADAIEAIQEEKMHGTVAYDLDTQILVIMQLVLNIRTGKDFMYDIDKLEVNIDLNSNKIRVPFLIVLK